MTTTAVIFDLFGTLVRWPDGQPHTVTMAERLGVAYDTFRPLWSERRRSRDSGDLTSEASIREVCVRLGVAVDEELVLLAARERVLFLERTLTPRADALPTLQALRASGRRIAILSDASSEVPMLWRASPMAPLIDVAVFSCIERTVKPDQRLYQAVCERLGIDASHCVYVGNGDGNELAGALASGMRAILFTGPGESPGREAPAWRGHRISDLAAVASLI